jgi:hypothetical protein
MCRGHPEQTKYLRPFKKATPGIPAESGSHPSSSGAAPRRAAACRSPRASVRQHYTLVAQSVEHSGPSLHGRGLRAARFSRVMIISAALRRICSWNETTGIRSVGTHHAGWACYFWSNVVCAEPFVITVVAVMSIEQCARNLMSKVSQGWVIYVHHKAERDGRNPDRDSETGRERA